MKQRNCPGCANPLPDDAAFCGACGLRIKPPQHPAPPKRSTPLLPVVAAVFFAALTGAVAVYFFLVRDRLNGEPTTGGDFSAEKRAALQQQFDDAGRIPALESLSPAANPVAANASTTIEAAVRNPDNLPYHLFWTASCGVVAQIPEQRTRAVFLAPPAGGPCRVTVELRSENMIAASKQEITIIALPDNVEDQEPGA